MAEARGSKNEILTMGKDRPQPQGKPKSARQDNGVPDQAENTGGRRTKKGNRKALLWETIGVLSGVSAGYLVSDSHYTISIPFLAILFVAMGFAVSIRWKQQGGKHHHARQIGRAIIIVGIAIVCGLVALDIFQRPAPNAASIEARSFGKWQPPELPENCQDVTLIWGGNYTDMRVADVQKERSHLIRVGNTVPFVPRIENNRLYLDCDIPTQDFGLVKIRGHVISPQLPQKWDMNTNSNALEIANENTCPLLQLYYRRPDQVAINGVFEVGGEMWFLSQHRWETFGTNNEDFIKAAKNGFKEQMARTPPLFKYPAWNHPGALNN